MSGTHTSICPSELHVNSSCYKECLNVETLCMFILSTLLLLGGFAFLPFLWLVNVLWFFKEAFIKPNYTEQLQIKKCKYEKQSCVHIINL